MVVTIKTGTEAWSFIISNDLNFIRERAIQTFIMAKEKYPNERTSIQGLPDEEVIKIKKTAYKLMSKKRRNK
ncbi:MAG: hypothetical protein RMJ67_07745 [Elusimicrobiota bacterium]|nr:hypothetical protein [Endomicrobiia bacterium]MDW8166385.1 hypothetical protein [Elusimicrobiota bacterium]